MLLLFLAMMPSYVSDASFMHARFIVWNVGQGQWTTFLTAKACHHFDLGGERFPARKIQKLCGGRKNYFYISHWDWDHLSFLAWASRRLPQNCVRVPPLGATSFKKRKILEGIRPCAPGSDLQLTELTDFSAESKSLRANELSHVLKVDETILIPGDSTKRQEKLWVESSLLAEIKILVLGHHGSATSSSDYLLRNLPRLKIAIASAREKKYGHPHPEVRARLRKLHVPLLRTEDWGNIYF